MIIVGHGGSGLGEFVKAGDLTDEEKHFLRSAMCSGASAEIRKCGTYDSAAEMMLLTVLLGGDDHMSEAGIAWHGDCRADGSSVGGGKTRHWWVPRDAGLSGADLKAVNQLNRDIDRCIDTRNESIARGVLTIEAINHMYQHCADKAWADYRKARQGVKGESHGD